MDTIVTVIERKLTDGSEVYEVLVGGLLLRAVTQRDAEALADKLSAAIDAHTNETVNRELG